jgi:inner membrane protein
METIIESAWNKSKLLVKAVIIGVLVLVLMIPTYYVQNLIEEREQRQKEATVEVSSKWAGKQNIAGPILVLPYFESSPDTSVKKPIKHYAFFLPNDLQITTNVDPQERSRGIYKVMLYNAQINLSGSFKELFPEKFKINPESILWNEAYVKLNISDARGLNEELKLQWNDSLLTLSPQVQTEGPATGEGLMANIPQGLEGLRNITFSTSFNINGSEQILFTPVGKTTNVKMISNWVNPSFTGNTLPQSPPQISDSGFTADWKSFSHKRAFAQHWKDASFVTDSSSKTPSEFNLGTAAFGANLFIPVNGYQKTMRSVKYAILCILLTFAAFFLIDVVHRKSIHPFQYGLIGLALVLFYVLLLSFSEYIGFNVAYSIAAVATIGLIAWFAKGILSSGKLSTILSIVLLFVYAYIFTILQLQDYALLIGSIGLFISLAVIMHFSRKIQW